MRYDLLYILPVLNEEAPNSEVKKKIGELLQRVNATIIREEEPSKKKICYPIQKARYGYYGNVAFEAEPIAAHTLHESLALETGILRFQIVKEEQTAPRKLKPARVRIKRPVAISVPFVSVPIVVATHTPTEEKVNLEELDKKLEELLSENIT